jgi:hypothetical protein
MGRLFSWIHSAATKPRSLHRGGAVVSRRRRLAFERCESRIALSTADGDLTEVAWSDSADYPLDWHAVNDGGAITISFTASDSLGSAGFASSIDAMPLGHSDNFLVRAEAFITMVRSAAANGLTTEWKFQSLGETRAIAGNFDLFDATADGDYGMSLNGSELASPSINSDLSVIPTPTPHEQPGVGGVNEGGQIALTPFVAPTGLTLSQGEGASGLARVKPMMEESGEAPAIETSDAAQLESLRGRAVIYEVADAARDELRIEDSSQAVDALADPEAVRLAALNELAPANFNGASSQRQAVAQAAFEVPLDDHTAHYDGGKLAAVSVEILATVGELFLNGDAPTSPDDLVAAIAGDRDEVFANWQAVEGVDAQSAALIAPHSDRDRRMLGISLAAAFSFIPLRKALRRRSGQVEQHQLPQRSPLSQFRDRV